MTVTSTNPNETAADMPVPQDDGRARHLEGMALPDIALPTTSGTAVNLSKLSGRCVVYIYPRTRAPETASLPGWETIPGARGCTLQTCSFRDHSAELAALGVRLLFGLSTQDSAYQREAVERLHLPFSLLSDEALQLTRTLKLPSFIISGLTLLKRMAWVLDEGKITKVFYPVFPPEKNAEDVIIWLRTQRPLPGD
jgi:peroxiredoxin